MAPPGEVITGVFDADGDEARLSRACGEGQNIGVCVCGEPAVLHSHG